MQMISKEVTKWDAYAYWYKGKLTSLYCLAPQPEGFLGQALAWGRCQATSGGRCEEPMHRSGPAWYHLCGSVGYYSVPHASGVAAQILKSDNALHSLVWCPYDVDHNLQVQNDVGSYACICCPETLPLKMQAPSNKLYWIGHFYMVLPTEFHTKCPATIVLDKSTNINGTNGPWQNTKSLAC